MNPNPAVVGYLDLRPGYRLRMVSPVFREGAAVGATALADSPATTQTAAGGIEVTARARMLFLTRASAADRDALVIAARSAAELAAATRELNSDPARCETAAYRGRCAVLPRQVALTAFAVVLVNGREVMVTPGASVREALRAAAVADPAAVAGRRRLAKSFGGRLVPVALPGGVAVLELPLAGGERIGVLADEETEGAE